MIFHQIGGQNKLTLWNKITLILWIGISLALLSFFTFTFFIIALVVGVVIFTMSFFRSTPGSARYSQQDKVPPFPNPNYRHKPPKDDDIIDI